MNALDVDISISLEFYILEHDTIKLINSIREHGYKNMEKRKDKEHAKIRT